MRALDHIVIPCADLDAATTALADCGFQVGRRNRHPWGTENHIVQLPGAFLELIARAPDAGPVAPDDDAFPFAGFLAGQGRSQAPSGMIVLRASDAKADADAFARDRIGAGRMLHFSRSGAAPDGTTRTVAFSLAFADAPTMPDLGFFVCQQHHPENFWSPAMQRHPNGVTGIETVRLVAERPDLHGAFLSRFTGAPAAATADGGLTFDLGEGTALRLDRGPGAARLVALQFRASVASPAVRLGALELRFG